MDGKKSLDEIGQKIKREVAEKKAIEEQGKQNALSMLQRLQENKSLVDMYKADAHIGAENIGGQLPLLKIHAAGKSKNFLADGTKPQDGYFFYKPTKEQFEYIDVHILTISRGFKAEGMENENGEAKEKFNQIMAGLIVEGNEFKPFVMYFTGLKLNSLWTFGKEISLFTHAKPVPFPMFSLKVRMGTIEKENKFGGTSWIPTFELVKDESGMPEIVLDEGKYQFLKDSVTQMEETINNLIASKAVKEEDIEVINAGSADRQESDIVDAEVLHDQEAVSEEIPFS